MNKKYLSVILFGALMLGTTGTFTSCKDYDDDINNLQEQVDGIKSDLKALQDKVNNGLWVTSVSPVEGGFTITFSDGQSYQIVNGKDGESADPGTIVSVSEDGYWVIGEEKTPYKALTDEDVNALKKNPYVNADGYWVFIVDGEEEVSNIKAEPVTAVFSDGVWTLSVYNAETKEYDKIEIPTAASLITELDLMGYATVVKASNNLDVDNIDGIINPLPVKYKWIDKIVKVYDGNKETTWSAQKDVVKHQVLTTLAPLNQKLIARLAPAELGWDNFSFTLQDSKGNTLPISLGTGETLTGALTKAADSSIGIIAMDVVSTTYNSGTAYEQEFNKAATNSLYSLVETTSNYRSTYGLKVDVDDAGTIAEQKVIDVEPNGTVPTGVSEGDGTAADPFVIDLNTPTRLVFGNVAPTASNPEYVYDYYVEPVDENTAKEFGFSTDIKAGTITMTQASDLVSRAGLELNVYALHIDGKIYKTQVWVKPSSILASDVVLKAGNQTIYPVLTGAGVIDVTNHPYEMSFVVSLDEMFNKMSATDKDRWTSKVMGANGDIVPVSVKVAGETYSEANIDIEFINADGDVVGNDKATALRVYAKYAAGAPLAAILTPDKEYTMTVNFEHNEGTATSVLNTVKVTFTPVLPDLSNFLAKKTGYWNENTLMAYFDDPVYGATAVLPSKFDMKKGFGTFGATDYAGTAIATIDLVLDDTQKLNNTLVVNGANSLATITSNVIELNTAKTYGGKVHAYNEDLNVFVTVDYLGVYNYNENANYKQQLADEAFQIKVQSALIAGDIRALEGTSIQMTPAAAGEVWKLTADHVSGYTYSYSDGNQTPYNIFKEWAIVTSPSTYGARWMYTYIQKVEFSSADTDYYVVTDAAGNAVTGNVGTAIDVHAEGNTMVQSYVPLKPVNTTEKIETTLKITVTDMYGYEKTFDVPLTINPAK